MEMNKIYAQLKELIETTISGERQKELMDLLNIIKRLNFPDDMIKDKLNEFFRGTSKEIEDFLNKMDRVESLETMDLGPTIDGLLRYFHMNKEKLSKLVGTPVYDTLYQILDYAEKMKNYQNEDAAIEIFGQLKRYLNLYFDLKSKKVDPSYNNEPLKDNILFDIMKKMEEFETKNKDEIELIKMVNKVPKDELLKDTKPAEIVTEAIYDYISKENPTDSDRDTVLNQIEPYADFSPVVNTMAKLIKNNYKDYVSKLDGTNSETGVSIDNVYSFSKSMKSRNKSYMLFSNPISDDVFAYDTENMRFDKLSPDQIQNNVNAQAIIQLNRGVRDFGFKVDENRQSLVWENNNPYGNFVIKSIEMVPGNRKNPKKLIIDGKVINNNNIRESIDMIATFNGWNKDSLQNQYDNLDDLINIDNAKLISGTGWEVMMMKDNFKRTSSIAVNMRNTFNNDSAFLHMDPNNLTGSFKAFMKNDNIPFISVKDLDQVYNNDKEKKQKLETDIAKYSNFKNELIKLEDKVDNIVKENAFLAYTDLFKDITKTINESIEETDTQINKAKSTIKAMDVFASNEVEKAIDNSQKEDKVDKLIPFFRTDLYIDSLGLEGRIIYLNVPEQKVKILTKDSQFLTFDIDKITIDGNTLYGDMN